MNTTLSSAERSKITGHLVIKMPKVLVMAHINLVLHQSFIFRSMSNNLRRQLRQSLVLKSRLPIKSRTFSFFLSFALSREPSSPFSPSSSTYLELGKDPSSSVDYTQIVKQNQKNSQSKRLPHAPKERENSADFIDDPDVPPLI